MFIMEPSMYAVAFIFSVMLAVVLWEIVAAFDRATKRIIGAFVWLLLALCRPVRWVCFKILQVAVLAAMLAFAVFVIASITGVPVVYWFNPRLRFYNGWD